MEIKHVDNSRFRNNEHFQFHSEVKALIEQEGADSLNIETQFEKYITAYNHEDEAFQRIIKNATTAEIESADKQRDYTFRGIADTVKAALKHFKPEVQKAAQRLKIVFDTYGNLAALPINEETSAIYNLLQELTGVYAAEAKTLGIEEWVNELEKENNTLESLVKRRNDENASKTELKMKSSRKELDESYHRIVTRIEAFIEINGVEAYKSFVRRLNEYIDKYNHILAQRTSKSTKG